MKRLHNYPNDHRFTREEAADLMGCSKATIAARNYAGLLPFIPGTRPIRVLAGDLKVLDKMLSNGHADKLHRSMRIHPDDCPSYSRLDGMQSLTYASPTKVIEEVVASTHKLYLTYKAKAAKAKTTKPGRRLMAAE